MIFNDNKEISAFENVQTVLESCIMAIVCPLGRFYPNKNYGNLLRSGKDRGALIASARNAVSRLDGVYIKNARIDSGRIIFDVLINDEARSVSINLEQNV